MQSRSLSWKESALSQFLGQSGSLSRKKLSLSQNSGIWVVDKINLESEFGVWDEKSWTLRWLRKS